MKFTPPCLNKFSLKQLVMDRHLVMLNGKRMSGKSTLLAEILFNHRYFRKFVVMSGSEAPVPEGFFFNLSIPVDMIRVGYDPGFLAQLWAAQKKFRQPTCLILDDLSFDKELWKNEVIEEIFFMGRHFKLGLIFASQYIMHVPPKLRLMADYVFGLGENSCSSQERLREAFFSYIPKKLFTQIFIHFTTDFGVLVSDCNCVNPDMTKCMYWFKAKRRNFRFHVGCRKYRKMYAEEQKLSEDDRNQEREYRKNKIDTVAYDKEGNRKVKKC